MALAAKPPDAWGARRRVSARLTLLSALLLPHLSHAQESTQGLKLYFVPELRGAYTLDLGLDAHLKDRLPLSTRHLTARVGYLHYLRGHGEGAVGLYLSGGLGLEGAEAARADTYRLGGGLKLRARFMNAAFQHISYGLFAEGEALFLSDRPETQVGYQVERPAANGHRLAAGLTFGPGALIGLGPFVWGELGSRLGYERVQIGAARSDAFYLSLSFDFDWGRRRSGRLRR
ncbi:hypothetical protein KKF91_06990 [Myxococcota bacterium]|nr:hypothetical protein [Myxococcota bacterium]MBU1430301.1 hypothetical protein [Myxococcota bacterium]MBU1896265.1 hypothetical protein [Myxococcota bacterium]